MQFASDVPIDGTALRKGMRHVPSVVTVVTIGDDSGYAGITIGSFTSLSLDPPLICFNVQRDSVIHDRIKVADRFVVHVLREDQAHLSDHFAKPDLSEEGQFGNLAVQEVDGVPILQDCLVTFYCEQSGVLSGGDHSIMLGRVVRILEGTAGRPVVYHRRAYYGIGPRVAERPTE